MRYDLTDFEWSVIEPLLPRNCQGVRSKHEPTGAQWDLLSFAHRRSVATLAHGLHTTCYDRFNRSRKAGIWDRPIDAITKVYDGKVQMIDTDGTGSSARRRRCVQRPLHAAAYGVPKVVLDLFVIDADDLAQLFRAILIHGGFPVRPLIRSQRPA
jgi:transposase